MQAPRRTPVQGSSRAISQSLVVVAWLTAALALGRFAEQYINMGKTGAQSASQRVKPPKSSMGQSARSFPVDINSMEDPRQPPRAQAAPDAGSAIGTLVTGALLGAAGVALGVATKFSFTPPALPPQVGSPAMQGVADQSTQLRMMLLGSSKMPSQAVSLKRSDSDASLSDIKEALEKGVGGNDALAKLESAVETGAGHLGSTVSQMAAESGEAAARAMSSGGAVLAEAQNTMGQYVTSFESAVAQAGHSAEVAMSKVAPTMVADQSDGVRMLLLEKEPTLGDKAIQQAQQAIGATVAQMTSASEGAMAKVREDYQDFQCAVAATKMSFHQQAAAQGQAVAANIADSMAQGGMAAAAFTSMVSGLPQTSAATKRQQPSALQRHSVTVSTTAPARQRLRVGNAAAPAQPLKAVKMTMPAVRNPPQPATAQSTKPAAMGGSMGPRVLVAAPTAPASMPGSSAGSSKAVQKSWDQRKELRALLLNSKPATRFA